MATCGSVAEALQGRCSNWVQYVGNCSYLISTERQHIYSEHYLEMFLGFVVGMIHLVLLILGAIFPSLESIETICLPVVDTA